MIDIKSVNFLVCLNSSCTPFVFFTEKIFTIKHEEGTVCYIGYILQDFWCHSARFKIVGVLQIRISCLGFYRILDLEWVRK